MMVTIQGESHLVVNNRRSEFEIIGEILSLAKDGTKKTRILYQTNLSYTQLQCYLSYLLESNILEIQNNNSVKIYKTTEKGLRIMSNLEKVIKELTSTPVN